MNKLDNEQWQWLELSLENADQISRMTEASNSPHHWVKQTEANEIINLDMYTAEEGREALWGSLVYVQDIKKEDKQYIFHFYLTKDYLITGFLNFSLLDSESEEEFQRRVKNADSPIEGFIIMMRIILSSFLQKIGLFEQRINQLLWKVKEKNGKNTLEKIAGCRHEILVWKNLLVPIMEISLALEEAFGKEVKERIAFHRFSCQMERAKTLIHEYEEEIESMVNLENVVSSLRGNEIMKTLTVLTILFTPVMAWGALWGMNFKWMPELKWHYGYLISIVVILGNTAGLYYYLKKKGWMGDILRVKKKDSFFD